MSRSTGSLPSVRAITANIPSPTFASPLRTRAVYACERPIRAANPRSDKFRSVFMMLSRYASANVKWLGAASATAADGVSGARLAFTAVGSPKKFTPSSPYHKDRCRTNRSVNGHSLRGLSASFPSVCTSMKLIHALKFRFSLTSSIRQTFFSDVKALRPTSPTKRRISPTKRTELPLPNGRTSPTKRMDAKNRVASAAYHLHFLSNAADRWAGARRCGERLLPNGRTGFLPNGRDVSYQTDGWLLTKRTVGFLPTGGILPLLVSW